MNYYDKKMNRMYLFKMICDLYDKKKYKIFLKKADKFLELYPYDLSIHYMKGKVLRELKCFEESIKEFKYVFEADNRTNALVELFYLYYFTRQYQEAMKLLTIIEQRNVIDSKYLEVITLVLKYKLNKLTLHDKYNLKNYQSFQIVDYSYNEALKHSKRHNHKNNIEKSQFLEGINLEYLFKLAKDNISDNNRYNTKSTLDIYYFGLSGIGVDRNGNLANFIKVVALPDTKDIITIHPVDSVDTEVVNIEYDRNIMFPHNKQKTKTLSQIEKFNKKYNKSAK